ncbi:MAG TPA: hypothetical protein DIC53_01730 [Synergistaceae bacterium]|nr:hypothetical protein [Synergistaceae bacterium]
MTYPIPFFPRDFYPVDLPQENTNKGFTLRRTERIRFDEKQRISLKEYFKKLIIRRNHPNDKIAQLRNNCFHTRQEKKVHQLLN